MKFWTGAFFVGLFIFFFLQTVVLAKESCPKIDSPEVTAIKYQLFAAYQTGFDGYEMPCELKCFGNKQCQNRCQGKEGLRFLQDKLHELVAKKGYVQCHSMTMSCVEQCKDLGVACQAACGDEKSIATK